MSGARAVDTYAPRILGEVATEYAAEAAGRYAGNLAWGAVFGAPSWVPGLTAAFARRVGARTRQVVRSHGHRAIGMGYDFRANRKPFVPQRRFPRQFVRQSHFRDRFRSGSRAIFWERPGDWKKQFLKFRKR